MHSLSLAQARLERTTAESDILLCLSATSREVILWLEFLRLMLCVGRKFDIRISRQCGCSPCPGIGILLRHPPARHLRRYCWPVMTTLSCSFFLSSESRAQQCSHFGFCTFGIATTWIRFTRVRHNWYDVKHFKMHFLNKRLIFYEKFQYVQ